MRSIHPQVLDDLPANVKTSMFSTEALVVEDKDDVSVYNALTCTEILNSYFATFIRPTTVNIDAARDAGLVETGCELASQYITPPASPLPPIFHGDANLPPGDGLWFKDNLQDVSLYTCLTDFFLIPGWQALEWRYAVVRYLMDHPDWSDTFGM